MVAETFLLQKMAQSDYKCVPMELLRRVILDLLELGETSLALQFLVDINSKEMALWKELLWGLVKHVESSDASKKLYRNVSDLDFNLVNPIERFIDYIQESTFRNVASEHRQVRQATLLLSIHYHYHLHCISGCLT